MTLIPLPTSDAPPPQGGGAGRPPFGGVVGGLPTWPLPFPRRWVIFFLFYLSLLFFLLSLLLFAFFLPLANVSLFALVIPSLFLLTSGLLLFKLWPSFFHAHRHELPLQRALGAHASPSVYAPSVTDDRARSLGHAVPIVLSSAIGDSYAAFLLDAKYALPKRLDDAFSSYALPRGYFPSAIRLPLGGSRLGVVFLRPPAIPPFFYGPGRWWTGLGAGGYPYPLDAVRAHWLVAGRTHGGKSHCLRGLIREFAAAQVAIYGIDAKGGVEFGPDAGYFAEWVDDVGVARDLLGHLSAWLRGEFAAMRAEGHRQRPLQRLLVIDELGVVISDKVCAQYLDELLRLGRAAGLMIVAATQNAQKSVLPIRDHFGCFVVLPVDDAQSEMLLPLSRDELAVLSPYRAPGVGLICPAWPGAYPIAPDRAVGLVRFGLVE